MAHQNAFPSSRSVSWLRIALLFSSVALLAIPPRIFAAFGVSSSGGRYIVDSGSGLVFKVNQSDGSIVSIVYNGGPELQDQSKSSHIASGLGSTTVTAATIGDVILITCATNASNSVVAKLTHYLMVRRNLNMI